MYYDIHTHISQRYVIYGENKLILFAYFHPNLLNFINNLLENFCVPE